MSVDDLRRQLRERGYLTHGIERWFALDPWSSRTFWLELVTVALKAAVLIGAFAALPLTAVMLLRNAPLDTLETLALFVTYSLAGAAAAFALIVAVALLLKLRPALPIDTPRALLAISIAVAAALTAPIAWWWWRFDAAPPLTELAAGGFLAIVFFSVCSIVVSAALLSFSIYELKRIPAIHQKPRGGPLAVAALLLAALLFVPAWVRREAPLAQPMVVTSPTTRRIALIAVDGLTWELFGSRPDLARALPRAFPITHPSSASTTERWASLGTGVRTEAHRVRSIDGVRFRGGDHVLQRLSAADIVLMRVAPLLGVARREPLPPTVRRRAYVWEIVASRGVPALTVNWWATADSREGGLQAFGPEAIFAGAGDDPLRIDALAMQRLFGALDLTAPRFATVYLPSLDVVLNRVVSDDATRLARTLRALDGVLDSVTLLRARGYEVMVVGLPGDRQSGSGLLASSMPVATARNSWDIAPTLLDLLGFPLSEEMPGRSLAGAPQPRISSYGERATSARGPELNQEYYESLKSLGYVQ